MIPMFTTAGRRAAEDQAQAYTAVPLVVFLKSRPSGSCPADKTGYLVACRELEPGDPQALLSSAVPRPLRLATGPRRRGIGESRTMLSQSESWLRQGRSRPAVSGSIGAPA